MASEGPLIQMKHAGDSDVTEGATVHKKHRMMAAKTCRVCGDKAVAHNFDVITCESCKAFFRRNALKDKMRPCAYQGNCDITVDTRRSCCYCRLKKCLDCGMKPELIMDADELRARQEKLTSSRLKRLEITAKGLKNTPGGASGLNHVAHDNADVTVSSSNAVGSEALAAGSPGPRGSMGCQNDDARFSRVCVSNQTQNGEAGKETNGLAASQSDTASLCPSVLSPATSSDLQAAQFQHVPHDELPSDPFLYWQLTEEERGLFGELTAAYEGTLLQHQPTFRPDVILGKLSPATVMGSCKSFATCFVAFFKRVADFRALTLEDRMAVLRGSSSSNLMLRSSANFVVEKDMWIKDTGYLPVAHYLEAMPAHAQALRRMADVSAALKTVLRNDSTAYALLHCVVTFDPLCAGLRDRQAVNALGDRYGALFEHHLQAQFSYLHAGRYLDAVRSLLPRLKTAGDRQRIVLASYVESVDPLMAEILNLVPV